MKPRAEAAMSRPNAPAAPPPLAAMTERKERLEAERAALFAEWKTAIEASHGNVAKAARDFDPPMTRDRGNRLTRRFALVEYAAQLRRRSLGRSMGTGKTSGSKR